MMKIRAVCFSVQGKAVLERLLSYPDVQGFMKLSNYVNRDTAIHTITTPISDWAGEGFARGEALVFIGAVGIAVRAIAGLVQDKFTDSPVISIDDTGRFVIPILSGHLGGANALALEVAAHLQAEPVITTSTDLHDAFSVDLFAKENHLAIQNREGIRRVSAKAIEGKAVTLCIRNYPPKEPVDVLVDGETAFPSLIRLVSKTYVVGIGCKRGKTQSEIACAYQDFLQKNQIPEALVGALATIDRKLDEEGLQLFAQRKRLPLIAGDADSLMQVTGSVSASAFVAQTVGVDCVCERAALLAAGSGAALVVPKTVYDGITIALARTADYKD